MILYLTQDLMLASNVRSVAKSEQIELKIVPNVAKLVESLGSSTLACEKVIVDLQTPGLSPDTFGQITQACSDQSGSEKTSEVIGYAQHVYVDLLEAAREAGFAAVLTRGQMNGNVAAILTRP